MGTSFGWGDEPAAPVSSRAANNGYNESPIKMAPNPAHAYSSPQKQHQFEQSSSAIGSPYGQDRANNAGFGDTGNSSIRLHAPSGGGNAMGTSFGWDGAAGGGSPSVSTPSSRNQTRDQPRAVQTSSSMKLAVGTHVLYKQIGKSGVESPAVIIDIEPVGSRKDNYRIRFEDGRERNTGEDKLTAISGGYGGDVEETTRGMAGMGFDQENRPPAQLYDDRPPAQGYGGAPQGYGGSPEKAYGGQQQLRSVEGASVGELQIGQQMMYRQTVRSEPEQVTVMAVELPSSNGFMRTKTFYQVQFSDGRVRETTIDKLKNN